MVLIVFHEYSCVLRVVVIISLSAHTRANAHVILLAVDEWSLALQVDMFVMRYPTTRPVKPVADRILDGFEQSMSDVYSHTTTVENETRRYYKQASSWNASYPASHTAHLQLHCRDL